MATSLIVGVYGACGTFSFNHTRTDRQHRSRNSSSEGAGVKIRNNCHTGDSIRQRDRSAVAMWTF